MIKKAFTNMALATSLALAGLAGIGCETTRPKDSSSQLREFYAPFKNSQNTYHIAGDILEARILKSKNGRFYINDKVYVPSNGSEYGYYIVVNSEDSKKSVHQYTEGYVIPGSAEMLGSLASKVTPGSSIVLKLPVKGKAANYWLTERNGQEHSVHLEPLTKDWGILLPEKRTP